MKKTIFITFTFTIVSLLPLFSHAMSCSEAFSTSVMSTNVRIQDYFEGENEPKKFVNPQNNTRTTTRQFFDKGHVVQLIQNHQQHTSLSDTEGASISSAFIENFTDEIATFLRKTYPRRNWSDHFIEKVGKNLRDYFFQSNFIVIRDSITHEIKATLRLIVSPYLIKENSSGQLKTEAINFSTMPLPVEKDFLGQELERPRLSPAQDHSCEEKCKASIQALFEVSSFSINKGEQRHIVAELLFSYFLYASFFPSFSFSGQATYYEPGSLFSLLLSNPENSFVYAYGDRVGQMMYRPYDFSIVQSLQSRNLMGSLWHTLASGDGMFSGVRNRYSFDHAVGDAIKNYNTSFALTEPFVSIGGQYNPLKPSLYDEEVEANHRLNDVLGGPSPQYIEFLKAFPGGPKTHSVEFSNEK